MYTWNYPPNGYLGVAENPGCTTVLCENRMKTQSIFEEEKDL